MEKLYLVRRNLESIVGPMPFDEFKRGLDHMEFGLQDEVAGHCSRWVVLENTRMLKRYYPAIYKHIYDPRKGWSSNNGGSDGPQTREERPLGASKRASLHGVLGALSLCFVAALVGLNWATLIHSFAPHLESRKEGKVEEVAALYKEARHQEAEAYLRLHLPTLTGKGQALEGWLPYLRWYAYRQGGEIAGISKKLLRGVAAEAMAPVDCSQNAWKGRWHDSIADWKQLLHERTFPRTHWGRMLAWDPHWIRRRPQAGWLMPESYFGACLSMAVNALREVSTEEAFMEAVKETHQGEGDHYLSAITARLAWLNSVVNEGGKAEKVNASVLAGQPWSPKTTPVTDLWTCLEAAGSSSELNACHPTGLKEAGDEWQRHQNQRFVMSLTRIVLNEQMINAANLEVVETFTRGSEAVDPYTRFDYRAEIAFLKLLLREHGDVKKSLERIRVEYPRVILIHYLP